MLHLKIKLENKKSYTGFGNYFSKSVILKDLHTKTLLVVENDKYQSIYEKIFKFFGGNLIEVKNNATLIDLLFNKSNETFIMKIDDFITTKINSYEVKKESLYLKKDLDYDLNDLIGRLTKLGYYYSEYFTNGSYRKVGDLIYVISFDGKKEYKLSFWGNTIENIWVKQKIEGDFHKDIEVDEIFIGSNISLETINGESINGLINESEVFIILDLLDFHVNYEKITKDLNNFCSFDFIGQRNNLIDLGIKDLEIDNIENLKNKLSENKEKIIFTKNKKLIENFTNLNNITNYTIFESNENLAKSFETEKNIVLCDDNISKIFIKRRVRKNFSSNIDLLLKISNGDYIVHIDHGIGIFNSIVTKELNGIKKEYIEIGYKDNDKLFVPITEVARVSKYVGDENPNLTGLNSKEWDRKIKAVNEDIERIAKELLETYANRIAKNGFKFERYKEKEKDFQRSFPYIYTEGQMQGIEDILNDMNSTKNMDRLLVGDVGFGKTEVAFNAIYTCFLNKKQACFISPLVVLAYEHFEKAKERFKNLGIKIEVLTRLETAKHTKDTIKKLENGEIDLIIGTHKLLGESIVFKNLGLIVVDEEHKFGVEDKEKLKKIKIKVDTLSMSATPIPRSLNMALSNIRDISILKDPPMGRKSIKTIVSKFDENIILEGCKNEFSRGGQVFFIHNRVENIDIIKNMLSSLMPDKKIIITHGRLTGDELEDRIIDFKNKKYDILLSTTVIENGIDFSNVNTIFINNCENFGLSQIHQLRGRVGRSDKQGYCYLLYKKDNIDKDAAKRLKTVVDYSFLGAGFEIAMRDLEIRGGGDILGIRQSGQKSDLSVNIFLELLEKKIFELKNAKENIKIIDTLVDLNIECYINDTYFNSETDKINFYKEIESIDNESDLDLLIEDFKNVNGTINKQEQNLFDIVRLRIKSSKYKITNIKKIGINYQIEFDKDINANDLKKFLELDKEVLFNVISIDKLRTSTKNFENDEKFLQYILNLLNGKILNKKIKLISKK
nr:CarD family transcriptional regulator [Candidatus Gracilibacteria bacterium]